MIAAIVTYLAQSMIASVIADLAGPVNAVVVADFTSPVNAVVIADLASPVNAVVIADFASPVNAVVIADFAGPVDTVVIADLAGPVDTAMVITRLRMFTPMASIVSAMVVAASAVVIAVVVAAMTIASAVPTSATVAAAGTTRATATAAAGTTVTAATVAASAAATTATSVATSAAATTATSVAASAAAITAAATAVTTSSAAITATASAVATATAIFGVRAGMGDRVGDQDGGCRQHPTNGKCQDCLFELHNHLHLLVLVIEPQTEPVQNEGHCPKAINASAHLATTQTTACGPQRPCAHRYREIRRLDHPVPDGVLGVNTPTAANIHLHLRTVIEDFSSSALFICAVARQHTRPLMKDPKFINANDSVSQLRLLYQAEIKQSVANACCPDHQ
jgi:hypothetical protein